MKNMIITALLLIGATSFAQVPTGRYYGSVSNTSTREMCRLTNATVDFKDSQNGQYEVHWMENGFSQGPRGGFCESRLDSTFTPTRKSNEWSVNFYWHNDIIFGKAVLDGNTLIVSGQFSASSQGGLQDFNAIMQFSSDLKTLDYRRTIHTWSGPSLIATGTLRQR